jgi:hypothetical protein
MPVQPWGEARPSAEQLADILERHEARFITVSSDIDEPEIGPSDDLRGISLNRHSLEGEMLNWADLSGAKLLITDLRGTRLYGAVLNKVQAVEADFRGALLSRADLSGAILVRADIRGANLESANLSKADVTDVRFDRRGVYRGIQLDGAYGNPRFIRFAKDQEFIEEFRSNRWRFWLLYLPWLIFADCGRSFSRWAAWSILFALFFGFVFGNPESLTWLPESLRPVVELSSRCDPPESLMIDGCREKTWFTPYYFSIVTFTTLGFGDITPLNLAGEIWITIEVILGYIMLGGLISILANKLARRS